MKKNILIIFCLILTVFSFGQNSDKAPVVVSFENKIAFNEMKKLNLDSIYPNLLNPRNVTESEYKSVTKSWSEFHQKMSKYIKEEEFTWEVQDSTIKISNRIYFDKNGNVEYYSFRIQNSNVTSEKRLEYEKLLLKFSEKEKVDLQRDNKFAQCGNIKYRNY